MKYRHLMVFILYLMIFCIAGCGFDDPYIPASAGSSTLKGKIISDPVIELKGADVFLRGQESFTTVADSEGSFYFQNIPPGDYTLQMQKYPYLRKDLPVTIHKAANENIGNVSVKLQGALAGTIPKNKIAIIYGELELVVYVNGDPRILERNSNGDYIIDLSSPDSKVNIRTVTKITVYIDNDPYYARIDEDGSFTIEFVPPGIYNDIKVKLNSKGDTLPLVSNGTIEVKSGQTRFLSTSF